MIRALAARFRSKLLEEATAKVKTHSLQNAWKKRNPVLHLFTFIKYLKFSPFDI